MNFPVRFTLLLFVLCFNESIAQEATQTNPFRAVLDTEELDKRITLHIEDIANSIYLANETQYPAVGVLVRSVTSNRNAQRAGVLKDSIIFQRGEHKSWASYVPLPIFRESYTTKLIGPDGNAYEAELDPGVLGIQTRGEYHLEIAYLRGEVGTRDPKWDRQMMVACMVHSKDPVLAETALYHAVKSGYPSDSLTDFFQIIFQTFTKNGPEKELEQFFSRFEEKEIPWIYLPPIHNALVVTGRIDFMERIATRAKDNAVYDSATIGQFLEWTNGKKTLPAESLLERVKKMEGRSISEEFVGFRRGKRDTTGRKIANRLIRSCEPGHYYSIDFRSDNLPQNVHYHARIRLQSNGLNSKWGTTFTIGFRNQAEENQEPITLRYPANGLAHCWRHLFVGFDRSVFGTTISTFGNELPGLSGAQSQIINIPYSADPLVAEELQEKFTRTKGNPGEEASVIDVDLIRYKNEMGVYINGICHLHLPCNPKANQKMSLFLQSVGMELLMRRITIRELND